MLPSVISSAASCTYWIYQANNQNCRKKNIRSQEKRKKRSNHTRTETRPDCQRMDPEISLFSLPPTSKSKMDTSIGPVQPTPRPTRIPTLQKTSSNDLTNKSSQSSVRTPAQSNCTHNSDKQNPNSAAILHVNALKLEDSEIDFEMTHLCKGKRLPKIPVPIHASTILVQKAQPLESLKKSGFNFDPIGHPPRLADSGDKASRAIFTGKSGKSDEENVDESSGKKENPIESEVNVTFDEEEIYNQKKMVQQQSKSVSKVSPLCAPDTIYFLYNPKERIYTGKFRLYCKSEETVVFKIKVKSPVSKFHFVAKPAMGCIHPEEKIEVNVSAQLLFDEPRHHEGEGMGGRYENQKMVNEKIIILATTQIEYLRSLDSWENISCDDLRKFWRKLERDHPSWIRCYILRRLLVVQENGDVQYKSCTHNLFEAMAPSLANGITKSQHERLKGRSESNGLAVGSQRVNAKRSEFVEKEEDKTGIAIVQNLRLVLMEMHEFQKISSYSLLFQGITLILLCLVLTLAVLNYIGEK